MTEQFRLGDGPAVAPARNGEGAPAPSSNGANGRVSVTALSDGPLVTVLAVRDVEIRQKRNGEDFLQLTLGDSSGKVKAISWDGVDELRGICAPGAVVWVRGEFKDDQRYGPTLTLRELRLADDGEYEIGELAGSPDVPLERLEADLRELIATVQNPDLRAAARRSPRRGDRELGPLPGRPRGQVLPPGVHATGSSTTASPSPRPSAPPPRRSRARPRHRRHRRPPARHRQDARLQRRPAGDRPDRRRPPPGRDPARLLHRPQRDRVDRRLRSRDRAGDPPHHPLPPRDPRERLAGRPLHPRGDPRARDRQPRRQARQLRPDRARAPRRRDLVPLRPRYRRRRLLQVTRRLAQGGNFSLQAWILSTSPPALVMHSPRFWARFTVGLLNAASVCAGCPSGCRSESRSHRRSCGRSTR